MRRRVSPDRRQARRTYRIASLPGRGEKEDSNPYMDLFYDALAPHGIELACTLCLDLRWLREHALALDAIHIHWPEWVLVGYKPFWLEAVAGMVDRWEQRNVLGASFLRRRVQGLRRAEAFVYFRRFLGVAKRAGLDIIWTCHNLEPHAGTTWAYRRASRCLARQADLVIVHSEHAREAYVERFPRRDTLVVMPIGNYAGVFPAARPRAKVLRDLGLRAEIPMVCCVGQIRPNKGLDVAMKAVARLGGTVQLVIAGSPKESHDSDALRSVPSDFQECVVIPRSLTNQEIADIITAAEAVVLPYRSITGSAALLTALTLGRGVITSDLPYFREQLRGVPDAGLLVPVDDAAALAVGIERYLAIPQPRREAAARGLSQRYEWSKVIDPVVSALAEIRQ